MSVCLSVYLSITKPYSPKMHYFGECLRSKIDFMLIATTNSVETQTIESLLTIIDMVS